MTCWGIGLAIALVAAEPAARRADVVIADFEGDKYGAWQVEGDAFGSGPVRGTLPLQQRVSGFQGRGLVNTFHGGDASRGRLTSPDFVIERRYINLLVGGGEHPRETCVNLQIGGKLVASETGTASTGADNEHLSWRTWDVGDFAGQSARIVILDEQAGGWGHVLVDAITQSDAPRTARHVDADIARAMASVAGATPLAQADPLRPGYHLAPPALWCNDPNGPIFHDGWYHVFYQHNPFGDRWEHMHWGHARSRDLAHWEHLPIALAPAKTQGEDHVFSGSAAVNGRGEVMLFYTSIGKRQPEQWGAVAIDEELRLWRRLASNPILTEAAHGATTIDDWRDPFVFDAGDKKWMVVGGHRRGGQGCACLYEAVDDRLERWKYLGIAYEGEEPNWECPNLFLDGEQAVLLYSPHGPVRYYTGQLDLATARFAPAQQGHVDFGGDYYATSACRGAHGQWLVWGWARGFPEGKGWNGCIALPREARVADDGRLLQTPARELETLRQGAPLEVESLTVEGTHWLDIAGNQLELELTIDRGAAERVGVKLLSSPDGVRGAVVLVDTGGIEVAGQSAPLPKLDPGEPLRLRIFVDRSLVEVFAGDDVCVTKVVRSTVGDERLQLFADGGQGTFQSVRVWKLAAGQIGRPDSDKSDERK